MHYPFSGYKSFMNIMEYFYSFYKRSNHQFQLFYYAFSFMQFYSEQNSLRLVGKNHQQKKILLLNFSSNININFVPNKKKGLKYWSKWTNFKSSFEKSLPWTNIRKKSSIYTLIEISINLFFGLLWNWFHFFLYFWCVGVQTFSIYYMYFHFWKRL